MITKNTETLKLLILLITVVCFVRFYFYGHIVIFISSTIRPNQCEQYCYTLDSNKSRHRVFGALASYSKIGPAEFLNHVTVPNCKPVKIWSLFRHGARWPAKNVFSRFPNIYDIREEILQRHGLTGDPPTVSEDCRLCKEDLDGIRKWKLTRVAENVLNTLAPQGWNDLGYLANSFRTAFPNLFDQIYSPETYLLRHTTEDRTELSYQAFVHHLFGFNSHNRIKLPHPPKEDMLLMVRAEILKSYDSSVSQPKDCRLCDEDLKMLKEWKLVSVDDAAYGTLVPQSWRDMRYLAKAYQETFPQLFDVNYSPETYLFRHTRDEKTKLSYEAFVTYLFGTEATSLINLPYPSHRDKLLTHYLECTKAGIHSTMAIDEANKFLETTVFRQMLKTLTRKLGFLIENSFDTMWQMCQLEQSWNRKVGSPWCSIFSPSDLKLINYWEDLNFYYVKSHGYAVNKELACSVVTDMMDHLTTTRKQQKVIVSFVHSTLLFLFLTSFGILKDTNPLLATNFDRMDNRRFKSSDAVPLSANFAAIKYECPKSEEKEKFMFLLNQKPLRLSQCNANETCTSQQLTRMFGNYNLKNCAKVFCSNGTISDLNYLK